MNNCIELLAGLVWAVAAGMIVGALIGSVAASVL